jgi:gas vesicle protein
MLMGLAVGAGAMYLLDPDHGAERRAKLLGFYGENKDTFQEYAQTAAQTAVTVGHTAASTASTVADKATELTGIGADSSKDSKSDPDPAGTPARSSNGKPAGVAAQGEAPGMGGSLSS